MQTTQRLRRLMAKRQEATCGSLRSSGYVMCSLACSWTIDGFSGIPSNVGSRIKSEWILDDSNILPWSLSLYPGGERSEDENHISVFLTTECPGNTRMFADHEVYMRFSVSLQSPPGKTLKKSTMDWNETRRFSGWNRFMKRKAVLDMLQGDVLVVHLEVDCCRSSVKRENAVPLAELSPMWSVSNNLLSFFQEGKDCDVVLSVSVDSVDLPAHKLVVAANSKIFAAMFEHDMLESKDSRIEITDFDAVTIRAVLWFMYSGKVNYMTTALALELLRASDKYDIGGLKQYCSNFLRAHIEWENAAEILIAADAYNAKGLRETAMEYFCNNVELLDVEENRSALRQQPDLLCDMVQHKRKFPVFRT